MTKITKSLLVILVLLIVLAILAWWNFFGRRAKNLPTAQTTISTTASPAEAPLVSVVAKNLEIPWSVDFLPDESLIFTERPGRIKRLDPKNPNAIQTILTINEVAAVGEGGLLGIVTHPDCAKNGLLYVYYTYRSSGQLFNKVVRYRYEFGQNKLVAPKTILDKIPGSQNHNGGRIKFGPDKKLYITTGDSQEPSQAQDKNLLAGKILRLNDDGSVPSDNPFPGTATYSYGHRNPQGLAWDNKGSLWATEHGQTAQDELNLIEPGKNYGWSTIRGDQKQNGLVSPVLHSGKETWAPSGMAFYNGSLFFAGLRGQSLFEAKILDGKVELKKHFEGKFGRLRDVVKGPDGMLYILTSNRDGRGVPTQDDDQIIKINPKKL